MAKKHTFGFVTKSQNNVKIRNLEAQVADTDDLDNPNHPEREGSPNFPRAGSRLPGYQNPVLGDDGIGKIGRWNTVNMDEVEDTVTQIIEQYMRDRSWYSQVRCREALWNMYRRIEWWVMQEKDPSKSQYQRVLQMIKDCINSILESAQNSGGEHQGVALPICPAPYLQYFFGDYVNHFDHESYEILLFSSKNIPLSDEFPGHFRYVSSSEEQEWEIVHSVGVDESKGSEMILKFPISRLSIGNSSKITFNHRVKKRGYIKFKYLASVDNGNGLAFFINGYQVGGQWNRMSEWAEAKFNVSPGQTHKFDWLIRRLSATSWGKDAIYIKDIEIYEVVSTDESPTPPDYDTIGELAKVESDWWVRHTASVAETEFNKHSHNAPRVLEMELDNECDGVVSFSYKLGTKEDVNPDHDYNLFFEDDFLSRTQRSESPHGSLAKKVYDSKWDVNGAYAETQEGSAVIDYEIIVGEGSTVDILGQLEIICPDRDIDHYEPTVVGTTKTLSWNVYTNSNIVWSNSSAGFSYEGRTIQGYGSASTTVYMPDDGWFTFRFGHSLGDSEHLEVLVDGARQFYSRGSYSSQVVIPLKAGYRYIEVRLVDSLTEQPIITRFGRKYSYGQNAPGVPFSLGKDGVASGGTITRNWETTFAGAQTGWGTEGGSNIVYNLFLTPGSSFKLEETLYLFAGYSYPLGGDDGYTGDPIIFEELFNDPARINPRLSMSSNWEWKNIFDFDPNNSNSDNMDGVIMVRGKNGSVNTVTVSGLVNPSYVFFQYGGVFNQFSTLRLYANDMLIWADPQSTSDLAGNNIVVPIPFGTTTLRWEYEDKQVGSIVTDPTYPTIPGHEETCYPAGNEPHSVGYSTSGLISTSRGTEMSWGGSSIGSAYGGQYSTINNSVITRDFVTPSFGAVDFRENLRVYAGDKPKPTGLIDLNTGWNVSDNQIIAPRSPSMGDPGTDYFLLHVKNLDPGSRDADFWSKHTRRLFDRFYTDGSFKLEIDIQTYLRAEYDERGKNRERARLRIYYKKDSDPDVASSYKVLFDTTENIGKKQYHTGIRDWSQAKRLSLSKSGLSAGWYTLYIGITDIQDDRDEDRDGIWWYSAIRKSTSRLMVTDANENNDLWKIKNPTSGYDGTYVLVELIDKMTGQIVTSYQVAPTGGYIDHTVNFSSLQYGRPYQVRYTLVKGGGTTGGLEGTGGAMVATQGSFNERWVAYCRGEDGRLYPKGGSPYPTPDVPPTYEVPPSGSWCWLDVIRVYSRSRNLCSGTMVTVTVTDDLNRVIDSKVYSTLGKHDLSVTVTNTTNIARNYQLIISYYGGCPTDGARLINGSYEFIDVIQPPPSSAWWDMEVVNNKPIYMGGCDSSNIRVTVVREDGHVLIDRTYYGGLVDYSEFSVSGLPNSPYTKYTVHVETEQFGQVSPVTGRSYLTTFRVRDFKAYERWVYIPKPFSSKLRFYIDGALLGEYTEQGGFYEVEFPIQRGSHVLKWEFLNESNHTDMVYDFAQLDYVKLTNWICDFIVVVPYCEPGGGDKCVEALIHCLLKIIKERPKACVIGKRNIWLFT